MNVNAAHPSCPAHAAQHASSEECVLSVARSFVPCVAVLLWIVARHGVGAGGGGVGGVGGAGVGGVGVGSGAVQEEPG
jgi:hypothetical protein